MGEGENGASHRPLPKMVVRLEDTPLKSPQKRPMPKNRQLGYSHTLAILADYSVNSSLEVELADQLKESYEQYQAGGSEDSYVHLCEQVATLKGFLECKNKLYTDNLSFANARKNFDIQSIPTTHVELLAAVKLSHTGGHRLLSVRLYCIFLPHG